MTSESLRPAFAPRDAVPLKANPLMRVLSVLLLLGVFLAGGTWMHLVVSAQAARTVRSWAEDLPQGTLTPDELKAAMAMPKHPRSLVVLTYHEVSSRTAEAGAGAYTLSPEHFDRQLAALDGAGYRSVTLRQVGDFLAGRATLPIRPVLITFDDGHATDFEVADKILAFYRFNAVAFIITGSVGPGDRLGYHLNVEQLQSMLASGRWELGSHTHATHYRRPVAGVNQSALDHRLLRPSGRLETQGQWKSRVGSDLAASQEWFRANLGMSAVAMAYPFGAFGGDGTRDQGASPIRMDLRRLLVANGFNLAFAGTTEQLSEAVIAGDDPLTISRIGVERGVTAQQLLGMVRESIHAPMPPNPLRLPWQSLDATCLIVGRPPAAQRLEVSSEFRDVAECRPVANSSAWTDYAVRVRVHGVDTHDKAALITLRDGRMWSQPGRIEVAVRRRSVTITEVVGRTPRRLGQLRLYRDAPNGREVVAAVWGHTVTVVVDGREVRTARTSMSTSGGPALTALTPRRAKVVFDRIALTPARPAARR